MIEQKRLIEVFPEWSTGGGIFKALQLLDVPWKDNDISLLLDVEYYGNISGDKYISPLIEKMLSDSKELSVSMIANVLLSLYKTIWDKQWATMSFDYNPIENYDMREVLSNDITINTYGKTVKSDVNSTSDVTSKINGFNSNNGVAANEQNQQTEGTQTDTEGGEDKHNRNYLLTRAGNIGVTTSQQMIESERTLWTWNYFKKIVFPDVDNILTLSIY